MKKVDSYIVFLMLLLCLTACQKEAMQPKVYGRFVPERKDDFAWENEYAAYRFYGPALAPENPSNGVDIFMKNTPEFVLDTFFYNYVNFRTPYHVQHGKGFDGYKVAHTTGCGGPAIVVDDALYVGNQFDSWEIVEQTPNKLVFRLHYDSLHVAGVWFSEDITVTSCAGEVLNKAELVLKPLDEAGEVPALQVGAGLYLHDSIGTYQFMDHSLAYTETALSDPGAVRLNKKWYDNIDLGQTHEAIIVPGAVNGTIISNTAVLVRPYTPGETLTYWFGGCWDRWTDGKHAFPTHEAWSKAIAKKQRK